MSFCHHSWSEQELEETYCKVMWYAFSNSRQQPDEYDVSCTCSTTLTRSWAVKWNFLSGRYLCNYFQDCAHMWTTVYVCCNRCCVTVVYSPTNRVNNPQHHQRILNSGSSGHDSGTHSESPSLSHTPGEQRGPRRKAREIVKWGEKTGEEGKGKEPREEIGKC